MAFCATMRGLSWLKCSSPFWVFAFAAFCATPLPPQLPGSAFGILVPIILRPMTATGVMPGDIVIVLVFAAAAAVAATFVEGGVGICNIIVSLRKSWV